MINNLIQNGIREGSQLDLMKRRFMRNKLAVIGGALVTIYLSIAIIGPYLIPYDITAIDAQNRLRPPTMAHPMGTDSFGRDVFSRAIVGARISLKVATFSISLATFSGVSLGLIAGYFRGKIDEIIMRILDLFFAFPGIILALVVIAILGPGLNKAIVALAIIYTPTMARVTRGSALSIREEEYIMAAEAYGEGTIRILFKELLPNLLPAVVVQATISFALSMIAEAGLAFIGLGAQPPTPSWGIIISNGQEVIEQAWWITIGPGLLLIMSVLGLSFLGMGLRDALDPKMGDTEQTEAKI